MKLSGLIIPPWAKVLALVAFLAAVAAAGAWAQRRADAGERERLRGALGTAAAELKAANQALAGSARALRIVDAETAAAIEREKADRQRAEDAAKVARRAAAEADRRAADYSKRLRAAAARRPGCAELLAVDVEEVCGISGESK
jgi:hypothetical protein